MLALSTNAERVLVFILFDVWMYFWHMANHRIGFLWRFHRAHHADTEMDTTTALRFHPGELIISSFVRLPVVIAIGMSFTDLILFEVLLNISTLFHHSNLAVPERWDRLIRTVIVTPNMHRVHHSIELRETNSNFTSLVSAWDRIAGTFKTREDTRAITLGLPVFREASISDWPDGDNAFPVTGGGGTADVWGTGDPWTNGKDRGDPEKAAPEYEGTPQTALGSHRLELLVATILSAQTTGVAREPGDRGAVQEVPVSARFRGHDAGDAREGHQLGQFLQQGEKHHQNRDHDHGTFGDEVRTVEELWYAARRGEKDGEHRAFPRSASMKELPLIRT
jgi:hypothetical protein